MSHELTADQALSLAYAQADTRAAVRAAFIMAEHFGAMIAAGREPMLTRIKFAWWREHGLVRPVAGTPAGDAALLLGHVQPATAALLDAYEIVLDDECENHINAAERGATLFALVAAVCECELTEAAKQAGRGWGVADYAVRHQSAIALAIAADCLSGADTRGLRGALRPIGILTALAKRDARRGLAQISPPGSPRRMVTALSFALFNSAL